VVRSTVLDHVKNSPSLLDGPTAPMAFNTAAESRISQLDFDGAAQALVCSCVTLNRIALLEITDLSSCRLSQSSEVVKLEKMLVYERSNEEEFEISE
jgi:hypothetical protein